METCAGTYEGIMLLDIDFHNNNLSLKNQQHWDEIELRCITGEMQLFFFPSTSSLRVTVDYS